MTVSQPAKVLVFNPNTNKSVTESFKPFLEVIELNNIQLTYWTCLAGPSLIKTEAHMYESASHCLPPLLEIADEYDGFLGACYADHPIVRLLQSYVGNKPVVGIFDASILAANHLTGSNCRFGIITTGSAFELLLAEGVKRLLGHNTAALERFSGVTASGIGADDLKPDCQAQAKEKVMSAPARLIALGNIDVICVGGVILAGMESWIREACQRELGLKRGREVKIIEQLAVGALMLDAVLRRTPTCDFSRALR